MGISVICLLIIINCTMCCETVFTSFPSPNSLPCHISHQSFLLYNPKGPSPNITLSRNEHQTKIFPYSQTAEKNKYLLFLQLFTKAGRCSPTSEGRTSGKPYFRVPKIKAAPRSGQLSWAPAPPLCPPFPFSPFAPSPQLQSRKAVNLQRSNTGPGLPGWESLVADLWSGVFFPSAQGSVTGCFKDDTSEVRWIFGVWVGWQPSNRLKRSVRGQPCDAGSSDQPPD